MRSQHLCKVHLTPLNLFFLECMISSQSHRLIFVYFQVFLGLFLLLMLLCFLLLFVIRFRITVLVALLLVKFVLRRLLNGFAFDCLNLTFIQIILFLSLSGVSGMSFWLFRVLIYNFVRTFCQIALIIVGLQLSRRCGNVFRYFSNQFSLFS